MASEARRTTRAVATFDPIPSRRVAADLAVEVSGAAPPGATAVAVAVGTDGPIPDRLGLGRAALTAAGFTGAVGQALAIPGDATPELVVVGIGDPADLGTASLRDAGAAFARATYRHASIAATLGELAGRRPGVGRPGGRRGRPPRALPLPGVPRPAGRGRPRDAHPRRRRRDRRCASGPAPSAAGSRRRPSGSAATSRTPHRCTSRRPGWRRSPRSSAAQAGLEVEVFDHDALSSWAAAACSASTRALASRRG